MYEQHFCFYFLFYWVSPARGVTRPSPFAARTPLYIDIMTWIFLVTTQTVLKKSRRVGACLFLFVRVSLIHSCFASVCVCVCDLILFLCL